MKIKRVELNRFKRFTHLEVRDLPETARLVVLVGPNGSGKTSFLEAFNHYYKCYGYADTGDAFYLRKNGAEEDVNWYTEAQSLVSIEFFDKNISKQVGSGETKGHFYFRSAYRNEPDFQIRRMEKQPDLLSNVRIASLIQNDVTVSANYQRLISDTISKVYSGNSDEKTVEELRDELIGKINDALGRVFGGLKLGSVGDPLNNGSFYFSKSDGEIFQYKNLSAGEKSTFDLILDMVLQADVFSDAIYCIDEPEAHMHTSLQGAVLKELYELLPERSQLWLSTHSIGMLQEAEEIEKRNPDSVVFLDFGDRDFDEDQILRPSKISKAVINKFYELAFGDFAKLMLPKTLVFCEGSSTGNRRKDFDKTVYSTIFEDEYPNTVFLSSGSCNDLELLETRFGDVMNSVLNKSEVIKIVDRDDRTDNEVKELLHKGIRTLSKRNLESYLLDDTVIKALCKSVGKMEQYDECLKRKEEAISNSVMRGNPDNDMKSASGEIYNALKEILGLTQCGNTADSFLRDTMAPLITPETEVYKQLENDIFKSE